VTIDRLWRSYTPKGNCLAVTHVWSFRKGQAPRTVGPRGCGHYDAIVANPNAMGVATRTGKAWMGPTVCRALKRGDR